MANLMSLIRSQSLLVSMVSAVMVCSLKGSGVKRGGAERVAAIAQTESHALGVIPSVARDLSCYVKGPSACGLGMTPWASSPSLLHGLRSISNVQAERRHRHRMEGDRSRQIKSWPFEPRQDGPELRGGVASEDRVLAHT